MNDDFGYLRSVIETIQRGRPWTGEWLEPWSASLATISALVFSLTGSFKLAIFGIQVVGAAATGAGFFALLCARAQSAVAAAAVTVLAVTFPTIQWKLVEYTSLVIYIPCLLWAIWSAERKRWMLFLLFWTVALASRQSAITWLAIPVWAAVSNGTKPASPRSSFLLPAVVAAVGLLAFIVLHSLLNKTQAQAMVTDQLWERVQFYRLIHHFIFGVGIWSIFTGIGALFLNRRLNELPTGRSPSRRSITMLAAAAGIFTLLEFLPPIFFEHHAFEGANGIIYRNLMIAIGLVGWSTSSFRFRWDFLLASVSGLALVCLRRDVWDYYFLDVGVFAAFGVVASNRTAPEECRWRGTVVSGIAILATLACFHSYFAFQQKCRVDRDYAACVVTEMALRKASLKIVEIGHAPYGFIGWHLHPYFLSHDGRSDDDIGGFIRYQRANATEVRLSPLRFWADSRSLRPIDGGDESRVVGSSVFRVGWLFNQRYSLLRNKEADVKPATLKFNEATYRAEPFPLTDSEWAAYIHEEHFSRSKRATLASPSY